ncbi:hypothetical protein D3C76_1727750 [compost metagenome]
MIGMLRVFSVPRISSASWKPFISGICTSMMAKAKSCCSNSDSASSADGALKTSRSCPLINASRANRFSGRSSTISSLA